MPRWPAASMHHAARLADGERACARSGRSRAPRARRRRARARRAARRRARGSRPGGARAACPAAVSITPPSSATRRPSRGRRRRSRCSRCRGRCRGRSPEGHSPRRPGCLVREDSHAPRLRAGRRSEPAGERVRQARVGCRSDPGDVSVGPDQHGGGSGDRAEHRKLPRAVVARRRPAGPGPPTARCRCRRAHRG